VVPFQKYYMREAENICAFVSFQNLSLLFLNPLTDKGDRNRRDLHTGLAYIILQAHVKPLYFLYSRTLDCEQLGLRVFYKTSKNFEVILTW
jgi:hypothetical protein